MFSEQVPNIVVDGFITQLGIIPSFQSDLSAQETRKATPRGVLGPAAGWRVR